MRNGRRIRCVVIIFEIAQWTIDRYRIVLEGDEAEGYLATSPELPEAVGQGQTAMRISVASWVTTEEDVDRSLEAMVRIAREVR